MIVTIDGPAGSGKSTAARGLAGRLGFQFMDTGAMYRAITLVCQTRGIDLTDEAQVAATARQVEIRCEGPRVFADGREVTDAIRTLEVTQGTRFVAPNVAVRAHLAEIQRAAARGLNVVTEGRDQGTTVFPHAECKFFLTAAPRQRALRRQGDLARRGEEVPLEEIEAQLVDRDRRDERRAVGPMRAAPDAILIDTSGMTAEQVLDRLELIVRQRQGEQAQ